MRIERFLDLVQFLGRQVGQVYARSYSSELDWIDDPKGRGKEGRKGGAIVHPSVSAVVRRALRKVCARTGGESSPRAQECVWGRWEQ